MDKLDFDPDDYPGQLKFIMAQKQMAKKDEIAKGDKTGQKKEKNAPATLMMKKVAVKAANKVEAGSNKDVVEKLRKEDQEKKKKEQDIKALRDEYRRIKRWVKEKEASNNSRIIIFPVLTGRGEWYKTVEFSALYYVYRLAERMGRNAKIYKDKDNFLKCMYTASLQNVEKLVQDFITFEKPKEKVVKTKEGVYILTLNKPLTDDEVGALRRTEETRRDLMHNSLKPKEMEPEAYQALLMVVRQVMPKIRKLAANNYMMLGEDMMRDIRQIMAVYFDMTNGLIPRKEAGKEMLRLINRVIAAFSILGETRVWDYLMVAAVAENLNNLKRIVEKKIK